MPKSKKASVLVYSLIILSVMLMIAAAFTTTSVISRKNASVTSKSSQSFQVADSGANLMLKLIKDNQGVAISAIPGINCNATTGVVTFSNANGLRSGSTAEVTFKDASDNPLNCSANVSDVDSIKSVGKFADTARAIEVAVAQTASDCNTVTVDSAGSTGRCGVLSLIISGENICADGDGCFLKGFAMWPTAASGETVYKTGKAGITILYQDSDGKWGINDTNNGTNGNGSGEIMSTGVKSDGNPYASVDLYDDEISGCQSGYDENSEDAVTLYTKNNRKWTGVICD